MFSWLLFGPFDRVADLQIERGKMAASDVWKIAQQRQVRGKESFIRQRLGLEGRGDKLLRRG